MMFLAFVFGMAVGGFLGLLAVGIACSGEGYDDGDIG